MKTMELLNYLKSKKAFLPYLYLVTGFGLFLFSNGRWTVPIFTWIAPFFLIRSFRILNGWFGIVFFVLIFLVQSIRMNGVIPAPGIIYYIIMLLGSIFIFIPFLADKWLNKKLMPLQATLVFPVVSVISEYVLAISNGYAGSWCSLAHTQINLAFLQIASITGG